MARNLSDMTGERKGFYWDKKVLVTGGAGFIGSHLVENLVGRGANVTVPVRSGTSVAFLGDIKGSIEIVTAELADWQRSLEVTENKDIVMHLAADTGGLYYNMGSPQGYLFRANLLPFVNIIEASRINNVGRFLTVSSACIYPRYCSIPTPESEGFRDVPEPTSAGYGWAKRMQEFLSVSYARDYGMKIAIARPYNCFGPRDNFTDEASSHVIPALIKRVFSNNNVLVVWGDGEQTRAFLYVDDLVDGLLEITEKYAVADPLNIGTDEEIQIKDLVKIIVDLSGKKLQVRFDSNKPTGQPRRNCDTHKAWTKIGFRANVLLREGLARTIGWFRANNRGSSPKM